MFKKIKENISNHPLRYFFTIMGIGFIAGIATVLAGYYFYQYRLNRTVNRELTEELVSVRREIERVSEELADSRDKIADVESAITECRELINSSNTGINSIREATSKIREQTKILQNFYNRINSIYSDTDNNSCLAKE